MVTIYLLIDPITKRPFYVGATKSKLAARLKDHCKCLKTWAAMDENMRRKISLIRTILEGGFKPLIKAVFISEECRATYCENLVYQTLIDNGAVLYQSDSRFQRHAAQYYRQFN